METGERLYMKGLLIEQARCVNRTEMERWVEIQKELNALVNLPVIVEADDPGS